MGDIKESKDIISFQPWWMRGWERQSRSLACLTLAKWQTTADQRWKAQRGQWFSYTFQSGGCSDRKEKIVSIKIHGMNYIKVIRYGINQSGWPGKWLWMFIYLL